MGSYSKNFKDILLKEGILSDIIIFEDSTKTSKEAAQKLDTEIDKIGKSIIFKTESGKLILVIASGKNRINEKIIEEKIKEKIIKIEADEIKERTGYTIGGIPPFWHKEKMKTFIDLDLLKFDEIFCAAGTPNSIFKVNPRRIIEITNAEVCKIT